MWQSLLSRGEEAMMATDTEGMEKLLKDNYAYISYREFLFNEYGHDCRIHIVTKPQFKKETSFALQKGSPLIPILNVM